MCLTTFLRALTKSQITFHYDPVRDIREIVIIFRQHLRSVDKYTIRWYVIASHTFWACNYISILGLKLNHVCKRDHGAYKGQSICSSGIHVYQLHQPWLWFITGGYLVKRWFLSAAARARGQSNDLDREILASNLFNCCKEVINAPPVPSISRCIHIVYQHKNVWEYQWSNFIYNCMSTFLHYVHCKDALLDCSAPGAERCESLTRVDEIVCISDSWFTRIQMQC